MGINPERVAAVAEWLRTEHDTDRRNRDPLADLVLCARPFAGMSFEYLRLCSDADVVRSICTAVGLPLSDATPDLSEVSWLLEERWLEVDGRRYRVTNASMIQFIEMLNGIRAPLERAA